MSNLQALFRSHVTRENLDPAALLASINRFFHQSTAPESFATAFYADFNEASGLLDYIGCGHPPALLRRRSGAFEFLAPQATVLGAFPLWNAASSTLTLAPGDRLLVVSDGAIEAQREIEEFGETRLRDLFDSTASLTPQHALETMEQAILDFSGGQLYDDCTLFLLSVR
jgi:sigma-B regulation protein RsbU (phosphoserine phosphatase)